MNRMDLMSPRVSVITAIRNRPEVGSAQQLPQSGARTLNQHPPRILFVRCWKPSQVLSSGGDIRCLAVERALRSSGDVEVYDSDEHSGGEEVDAASLRAAMWGFLIRLGIGRIREQRIYDAARSADVVFFHGLPAFRWTGISDQKRAIIDIGDIASQYFAQGLHRGTLATRPVKWLRYAWTRYSERVLLNAFRYATVCSEDDQRYLNHPKVRVVPNCYRSHPLMDYPPNPHPSRDLLFVGTLFYPPNIEGLEWFVKDILPVIRDRAPGTTLTVVGRSPEGLPRERPWLNFPGVEFLGTVSDVGPYVRSAKLEICPLERGGGTRIKLMESLAFGTPAVSTTVGAYGLSMSEEEGIFRRDTVEGFASACLELLQDVERRSMVGANGQAHVRSHYSPDIVAEKVAQLVTEITQ